MISVALSVVVALALAVVAYRWRLHHDARGRSRRARAQGRIAVEGERAAMALLTQAGYRILDSQVRHAIVVSVDAERYDAGLRCDYLVERAGVTWVAEVKTGDAAPSLANPATRRQLLEYQVGYAVAGVVLVDATAQTVHAVQFELAPPAPPPAATRWLIVGAVIGASTVGGLWWLHG